MNKHLTHTLSASVSIMKRLATVTAIGLVAVAAGFAAPQTIAPVATVEATGGTGCLGPGWPAPYNVACNPTVHDTDAPGVDRSTGGIIPADTTYCNTALFPACAAALAANPGATGTQLNYLPTDQRSAAEQRIEKDVADAINYERAYRGLTPLILSENLTKISHRYTRMFVSDTGLSNNGSLTDCPGGYYAGCDVPLSGYHNEAALINKTAFPGWPTELLTVSAVGAGVVAAETPGQFVSGLVCGDACPAVSTALHRKAVITNRATYMAVGVQCDTAGRTYMSWSGYARGAARNGFNPSDYETGGGTDLAPHVNPLFGRYCPVPPPTVTRTATPATASPTGTVTMAVTGGFNGRTVQACAETPGGPTVTKPATVTFTVTNTSLGTPTRTLSFTTNGGANVTAPQTFTGLPAGNYAATVQVFGCAADTTLGSANVVVPGTTPPAAAARFAAVNPTRPVDTRTGRGGARLNAGSVATYTLTGIPADAVGATLNVTAVNPATGGYLTVYPCTSTRPNTSTVNFGAGQTAAAQLTVGVAANKVCVYSTANADILIDVSGYLSPTGTNGFAPAAGRLTDTRNTGVITAGGTLTLNVANSVPANAQAVDLNITATGNTSGGYITAYPCGTSLPTVSNVNYAGDGDIANHAVVAIPPSRTICFYASTATHLVVDITGYWAPTTPGAYTATTPTRPIDTRNNLGGPKFVAGEERQIIAPAPGAMILTVTVAEQTAPGWAAVYPCGAGWPGVSTLNYVSDARANSTIINTATGVCAKTSSAAHLILDRTGTLG